MTAIAKELRLSVSRISRLIAVADMAGYTRGKRQDLTPRLAAWARTYGVEVPCGSTDLDSS